MKPSFTLLFLFLVTIGFSQTKKYSDTKDVEWLAGHWTRTNVKPGNSGFEQWSKKSATELIGDGISMRGSDTTFHEKLKIVVKDGDLHYVVKTPDNKEEVWFRFIEATPTGFVCENPTHDFPKKITYALDGNKIKATISGDGKSMDFLFTRK